MALLPVDIIKENNQWNLKWLEISPNEIIEPFFKHTIKTAIANGKKYQSSLLNELLSASQPKSSQPTLSLHRSVVDIKKAKTTPNIIFHLSRCGSTLAAQMLSEINKITVIAEPAIINKVLATQEFTDTRKQQILEKIINTFIFQLNEQYVVFKLSSWNVYSFSLFKRIYPHMKAIFMYRTPSEVIQSHLRHPAGWLKSRNDGNKQALINECTTKLSSMMQLALDIPTEEIICIDHHDMPSACAQIILPHFHIKDLTSNDINIMLSRSQYYSKNKGEPFEEKNTIESEIALSLLKAHYDKINDLYHKLQNKQRVFDYPQYYEEAKKYENKKYLKNKLKRLKENYSQFKDKVDFFNSLQLMYRKAGNLKKAKKYCKEIHKLLPNDTYFTRANAIFSGLDLAGDHRNIPELLPAEFVQKHHFLNKEQHQQVLDYTREHQEYCNYSCNAGSVNFTKRKTLVINLKGENNPIITLMKDKILNIFPTIISKMSIPDFKIYSLEMKISIHLNDFYFKAHTDDKLIPNRKIAFLYYFNFSDKNFTGGDLLLFDTNFDKNKTFSQSQFTRITPINNSILFIPSGFYHAVSPVILESNEFQQGRFCISGHIKEKLP
ncbi:2OG-Fe(II) oxygenase [uncultured Shewanella sp.]|uniref:2OG-Fe(II) oxygenase n=1 Tax=uncultured Shewanella sp. TaxID=173975 RepID=UPI0026306EED|nr:2OG-Fe(II) oxygenase [uncultured Shewanella sp.]